MPPRPARADVHRSVRWAANKLEGAYVLSGKLEHGQAGAAADVDAAESFVSERGVEGEGRGKVGDAVARV